MDKVYELLEEIKNTPIRRKGPQDKVEPGEKVCGKMNDFSRKVHSFRKNCGEQYSKLIEEVIHSRPFLPLDEEKVKEVQKKAQEAMVWKSKAEFANAILWFVLKMDLDEIPPEGVGIRKGWKVVRRGFPFPEVVGITILQHK